ncbi:MAG TPA: alpha-amylase [Chloroflexi bacterium]|nr:alpha-amylase [Chloroflexota bacterium]
MEEFIFGTYATDELKLIHHRAARSGLQHRHALTPQDPQPGEPVTLTVHVGPDLPVECVACYYTVDDSEPDGARGAARNGRVLMLEQIDVRWDTLAWGYVTRWQGVLPAQPEGVIVRYHLGAWAGDGPEAFADWPDVQDRAEQAADAFFHGKLLPDTPPGDPTVSHTFAYSVDRLVPPTWAREAVIYQIFVDRFYPGQGQGWAQTKNLRAFCGGTLWGVAEKLDYVADLGATCIWLSPIFVSPSHHGYDAVDLRHVEPRLGGDEALRTLIAEAHRRGIRVLLDYVCNHVSQYHPLFVEAKADPGSPYRRYFTFDDSEIGYRTFFNVANMPQVNVAHPAARDWLIDIARYWLRAFDVDGYRLDYANGPGPDFWTDFWTACKAEKPDCFCFGEIVDTPEAQRAYVGRLDGCLDFHVGDTLRRAFAFGLWTEDALTRFLARHASFFPGDFVRPTFIENHDVDRFLLLAGGDKEALRRAVAVQMRLSGPPIIYYGAEVGLEQAVSVRDSDGLHVNRVPMIWGDEQDRELLAYYKRLIRERRGV